MREDNSPSIRYTILGFAKKSSNDHGSSHKQLKHFDVTADPLEMFGGLCPDQKETRCQKVLQRYSVIPSKVHHRKVKRSRNVTGAPFSIRYVGNAAGGFPTHLVFARFDTIRRLWLYVPADFGRIGRCLSR